MSTVFKKKMDQNTQSINIIYIYIFLYTYTNIYIYICTLECLDQFAMAGILTSTADYSITSYRTAVSFHLFMAKFEAWISYQNTVTNYI